MLRSSSKNKSNCYAHFKVWFPLVRPHIPPPRSVIPVYCRVGAFQRNEICSWQGFAKFIQPVNRKFSCCELRGGRTVSFEVFRESRTALQAVRWVDAVLVDFLSFRFWQRVPKDDYHVLKSRRHFLATVLPLSYRPTCVRECPAGVEPASPGWKPGTFAARPRARVVSRSGSRGTRTHNGQFARTCFRGRLLIQPDDFPKAAVAGIEPIPPA